MGAPQGKRHNLIMVETNLLPIAGSVAGRAIGTILSLVHILFRVTGGTGAGRMFVDIARPMTGRAGRRCMAAHQRKPRCRVVKTDGGPSRRSMTAGTIRPAAAFVCIVLCVTGHASAAQSLPALTRMARHAGRAPMCAR